MYPLLDNVYDIIYTCLMSYPGITFVLLTLLMSGDSMKHKGSEYVRTLYSLTIHLMPLQSTCYGGP